MISTPCSIEPDSGWRRRDRACGGRPPARAAGRVLRAGVVGLAVLVAACECVSVRGEAGSRSGVEDVEIAIPL